MKIFNLTRIVVQFKFKKKVILKAWTFESCNVHVFHLYNKQKYITKLSKILLFFSYLNNSLC